MKPKMVSAILYATTAFTLWSFWDALFGAADEPFMHYRYWGLLSLSIAGTVLFVAACILTLFSTRIGTICALVGATLSWPYFALQMPKIPWSRVISVLPNANWQELLTAIFALIIASVYSMSELRRGNDEASRRNIGLKLTATFLYAAASFLLAYWRGIWEWLFRLRYGN